MTNGWPAPASQELGANWVGVTARKRVDGRFNQETETFETGASNSPWIWFGPGDEHSIVSRSALPS